MVDKTIEGHQGGQITQRVVRGQQGVKRAAGGLLQHHLKARGTQRVEMTILCPAKKVSAVLATLQRGRLGICGGNSLTVQVSIFAFDCPDEHFCSNQCVSYFSSNQ